MGGLTNCYLTKIPFIWASCAKQVHKSQIQLLLLFKIYNIGTFSWTRVLNWNPLKTRVKLSTTCVTWVLLWYRTPCTLYLHGVFTLFFFLIVYNRCFPVYLLLLKAMNLLSFFFLIVYISNSIHLYVLGVFTQDVPLENFPLVGKWSQLTIRDLTTQWTDTIMQESLWLSWDESNWSWKCLMSKLLENWVATSSIPSNNTYLLLFISITQRRVLASMSSSSSNALRLCFKVQMQP